MARVNFILVQQDSETAAVDPPAHYLLGAGGDWGGCTSLSVELCPTDSEIHLGGPVYFTIATLTPADPSCERLLPPGTLRITPVDADASTSLQFSFCRA